MKLDELKEVRERAFYNIPWDYFLNNSGLEEFINKNIIIVNIDDKPVDIDENLIYSYEQQSHIKKLNNIFSDENIKFTKEIGELIKNFFFKKMNLNIEGILGTYILNLRKMNTDIKKRIKYA